MRKVAAIAFVVFVLGISGSASALALYSIEGKYVDGAAGIEGMPFQPRVSGIIGVEGIDSFWDLKAGKTYEWFYNLAYYGGRVNAPYYDADGGYHGSESHWGEMLCTSVGYELGTDNIQYLTFNIEGDDGSTLYHGVSNYSPEKRFGQYIYWIDPSESRFYASGVNQIERPTQSVPEPSTMLLLASGLIGMTAFRKKMRIRTE